MRWDYKSKWCFLVYFIAVLSIKSINCSPILENINSLVSTKACNSTFILEQVKGVLEDKVLKEAFCEAEKLVEYDSTLQLIWVNLQNSDDLCDLKEIPYILDYCNTSDRQLYAVSVTLSHYFGRQSDTENLPLPHLQKISAVLGAYASILLNRDKASYNHHHICSKLRIGLPVTAESPKLNLEYFEGFENALISGILKPSIINSNDKNYNTRMLGLTPCETQNAGSNSAPPHQTSETSTVYENNDDDLSPKIEISNQFDTKAEAIFEVLTKGKEVYAIFKKYILDKKQVQQDLKYEAIMNKSDLLLQRIENSEREINARLNELEKSKKTADSVKYKKIRHDEE